MKSNVVIDPWGSILLQDYAQLMGEFGMQHFDRGMLERFPNPNMLMRRFVVFGHRSLSFIADAIGKEKDFTILTGIMPSGDRLHFGTKSVIDMVRYFQEQGGETHVLVADLEALATRGVELDVAKQRFKEFYLPAYLALGLDPKKTDFYFQSENETVKNMAYEFSSRITMNEFRAVYGNMDASRIMSSLLQAADILHVQLKTPGPTVVPVGIDQDPHLRLARDIADRFGKYKFLPPAATYHKFTPSLDGGFKMSKSKPGSYIAIPDDPETAGKKMLHALTGGRNTVEEQKKLGGEPDKCMIFEMYKQHLLTNDRDLNEVHETCRNGTLTCGEDKARACGLMKKFLEGFNRKFEKAKKTSGKMVE